MGFNFFNSEELYKEAEKKNSESKKYFSRIKKISPKLVDDLILSLHEEVFQKINCLSCALCCKNLGPLLKQKDIDRISKHLKLKPGLFIEKYLRIDEEGDYVFKTTYCPFLLKDNYCSIYEVCPKACSEYPHTNQTGAHKQFQRIIKNTYYCPAVFQIVEKLKKTNII